MEFCKTLEIDRSLKEAVIKHNRVAAETGQEPITFDQMFQEFLQRYTTYLQISTASKAESPKEVSDSSTMKKDAKAIADCTVRLINVMNTKHFDH